MTSFNIPTRTELARTFSPFLSGDKGIRPAIHYKRESKRQKFERKYGMLYTAASLVAGGGILYALHRGGKLFSITDFIKQQYLKYQIKTMKTLNQYKIFKQIRYATNVGVSYIGKKAVEFGNFVGNMNPFKDIAFDRVCEKIKIKPMFDKLTAVFTKSAKKLTLAKYERAAEDLLSFRNCLNEIAEHVKTIPSVKSGKETITGMELAKHLINCTEKLSSRMQNITGQNFTARFENTVSMLNNKAERKFLGLFKRNGKVSLLKQISNQVKECGAFLPRKIMEKDKELLYRPLMKSKMSISNSILDLYQTLSKSIDDVFYDVPFNNEALSKSYLKIRDLLTEFKLPALHSAKRANTREKLIQALRNAICELGQLPNGKSKQDVLSSLIITIKNDTKGIVEQSVSDCKALKELNPKLYEKLIKARNKFQSSFNEAINFETDKTYGKLLDFSLHSLPTDILTILLGIGGVSCALANHKKSRREKMKNNIEQGIPVLGGIAVSFLSNMRMVASGTGAIFLGLVSGIALNRIGKTINHFYWKHEREKHHKKVV